MDNTFNPEQPEQHFENALAAFVAATQAKIEAYHAEHYSNVPAGRLEVLRGGNKNVKIVQVDGLHGRRSVFCFVRIEDGAILKAAGWKAPAKHARGSIYVNQGQDAVSVYGAHYMR